MVKKNSGEKDFLWNFYPLEVQMYQINFVNVILWTIQIIILHIWSHIITTVFTKLILLFSVLGSMVSKNICKLHHKLENAKKLPELTWSWQNKPWCIVDEFAGGASVVNAATPYLWNRRSGRFQLRSMCLLVSALQFTPLTWIWAL